MPRFLFSLMAAAVVAGPVTVAAQAPTNVWQIDSAHTAAQFAVRHLMVSTVRGQLGKVTGTVQWDGKDVKTVAADVTIDVAGLNTREPDRDKHLRSADFFEAEKFPTATFKSKRVESVGQGTFKLVGDFTMKGVTKEIVLDVEGPTPAIKQTGQSGTRERVGATATGRINRKDFGLMWNRAIEAGGVVVGDDVTMQIDLELTRPAPPTAQ
jgi:polyisoprenoid-binding protein YceI